MRVRGVVEPMMYKDGQQVGERFYIGGVPNNKTYNIYQLNVSSPAQHFFFNRDDKVGHRIFTIDYTATIEIDGGAASALAKGASLLPAGARSVTGTFARGDVVDILGPLGMAIARGLSEYDSDEAIKIAGLKTADIEGVLGHTPRAAMVHRDHMVLL
jgi:glutamate 5-kinase